MITHTLALLVGFVAGALVFRNNAGKAKAIEEKLKAASESLKGK
jgi:uncharacterized membrane-anchored protein YhcB (DUF1043 family)